MATFNAWLLAARWIFVERGMSKWFTDLKAFANATVGTAPATYGAVDFLNGTHIGQSATGRTGIVPGQSFVDPGSTRNSQVVPKFDQLRD